MGDRRHEPRGRLVDADELIGLTTRLRSVRERIAGATVPDARRRLWQQQLAAIAESATADLPGAAAALDELDARIDRVAGR